jgi:hypothetical protein
MDFDNHFPFMAVGERDRFDMRIDHGPLTNIQISLRTAKPIWPCLALADLGPPSFVSQTERPDHGQTFRHALREVGRQFNPCFRRTQGL